MENKFDPLRLLVKGNEELKAAYETGVEFGREKEREVMSVRYADFRDWIDAAVKKVPAKMADIRGMGLSPKSQKSVHDQVRQWHVDGFLTALKMARKTFDL